MVAGEHPDREPQLGAGVAPDAAPGPVDLPADSDEVDGGPSGAHDPDDLDDAVARVAEDFEALRRERDELLDTSRRLQADFENFRKRSDQRRAAESARAVEGLVGALLPVLDTFEMALLQIGDDADVDRVRKGVDLVFSELVAVLERHGLERVDDRGAPFDPHLHEAVAHDAGDGDPVVAEVLRTGYRFKDRVVRPAMVRVAADSGDADERGGEESGGEAGS